MDTAVDDGRLAAAREAAGRHAWTEAYELLDALDRERGLGGAGLELLGSVAWWAAQPDISVGARERAFAAYLEEGDRLRAAYMALLASHDHHTQLSDSVAQGWRARAARILAEEPESFAHGYLELFEAETALQTGEIERAAEFAARAVDLGARYGDKDLEGYGLVFQGMAAVQRGAIEQGLRLLDEATAAAVGGELSPYATGVVYCATISTCRDLADYRRAGQWTEVAERWCERQAISGFPGVCRVHRAEILAIRGEWESAEEEASRASNELLSFKAYFQAAEGYYALAEIRLRMGDLTGADEALRQAQDLGRDPQPARALLYLAQGRTDAAALSIDRTLAVGGERLWRARLLPAQVEIAITAAALDIARGAAQELASIAEDYGSPALRAAAHYASASVRVAEQDGRSALEELARARTQWQTVEAPYELARVRGCTAIALRLLGETHEAELELESARAAFVRLGANLEVGRCDRVLEELRRRTEQGERQQRTFMFTDIVGSTELLAVIGDEAWNDLKRWHDQTLRSLVAKHGGEEVNEAGDGFFFAFEGVSTAVDAAIAIQRALAEHRRSAGFAPRVRIGLHAAEATKVQDSYVGQAVHQAARIGSVAGANEIVASVDTVADYTGAILGAPRAVELKGIPQPIEVCTIEWASDR